MFLAEIAAPFISVCHVWSFSFGSADPFGL